MKFKLTLIASHEDGTAAIQETEVTIPTDGMEGIKPTLAGALEVIQLRLSDAGFSVE
jgi:hypothetical protein